MKIALPLSILGAVLFFAPAMAKDFVLIDSEADTRGTDWSIASADLGITATPPFNVRVRTLHGGKQEGVQVIDVDSGRLSFTVVPTRGMNLERMTSGDVTLGWSSPVKEVVNPAFITLDSRGGLGWLDGFNEWLVRCG